MIAIKIYLVLSYSRADNSVQFRSIRQSVSPQLNRNRKKDNMDNLELELKMAEIDRKEHLIKMMNKKDKYHDTLVFILRTLDKEYNNEVQSTDNPIGVIRDKIDRLLNK